MPLVLCATRSPSAVHPVLRAPLAKVRTQIDADERGYILMAPASIRARPRLPSAEPLSGHGHSFLACAVVDGLLSCIYLWGADTS